jgi:hypothetical protein
MSSEQRQQKLLRRRENYNQSKEKGKQVETSTNNVASRLSFQNNTNMNFKVQSFKKLMTSKLDQVLDILMTPHLVSHDKKYILMYYIQFYIVTHSQKNYVLKYASVDSRQIFEVLMTMKHDQTEQILVTLLFSKSQLFI